MPAVRTLTMGILACLSVVAALPVASAFAVDSSFSLRLRSRVETGKETGRFHALTRSEKWNARETAFIVCDMWDLHHCLNATKRGAEMAPRMDAVLKRARAMGATIIHAPSSCMGFYKDHPARRRVAEVPMAGNLPSDIGSWCHRIPAEEKGKYPIDQSDGGEDDDPAEHRKWAEQLKAKGRNPRAPWIRQTDLLTIDEQHDFISDNGKEVWSILEQRGLKNVVLVGVHTNMCVLGRPFGLRQMAKNGKNVVLMRDMTDTMYNPARAPYVSHFTGTDLIVEHIEKWVCPTITSDQILGGKPFRFRYDKRPRLTILIGEREYRTNESLPAFAAKQLGKDFQVNLVFAHRKDRNDLPGAAEAIRAADLLLISVRRRALPEPQMQALRKHVESGKPVLGIRTANHAFSLHGKKPPQGRATWERFDAEIFGGNYTGHHGNGPLVMLTAPAEAKSHPILEGVDLSKLRGNGSLYKVSPLAKTAQPLLIGSTSKANPEPVAWVHQTKAGGRVFYTSLGHIRDFEQPAMQRLLTNALRWAAGAPAGDAR